MSVNVNRNVTDIYYRYKMPKLIAKVEGKGNGIKTVIVNMSEIAKSLSRPPTYPTKYFGCELGAQTQFDQSHDRYIINGSHEASKLQDLLDGFIKKFVLCQECENPETNLNVYQKKQVILQNCIACGHQANVDMRHKVTTYILKNPPDQQQDTSAETPGRKDKKASKAKGKSNNKSKEVTDNGNGDADNLENHLDNNSSSQLSKSSGHDNEEEDWGEDTSDAAVEARFKGLSEAAKTMMLTDDLEKPEQDRIDIFYAFVKERKTEGRLVGKEKEVVTEADRLDIKDKAPLVLAEVLFDANALQQIKQYTVLLKRFTYDNQRAQKYLLAGFEQLVGTLFNEVLMPKIAHLLKALYETDILDEETIIEWFNKPSKKRVSKEVSKEMRSKAGPFVKWLQEAEEESSEDDDDDEDDVEVVYSEHVTTASLVEQKPAATKAAKGDEDLNIDDI